MWKVYEIKNNRLRQIYIGTTEREIQERFTEHKSNSHNTEVFHLANQIDSKCQDTGEGPFSTEQAARKKEQQLATQYKPQGWTVLNRL